MNMKDYGCILFICENNERPGKLDQVLKIVAEVLEKVEEAFGKVAEVLRQT